MLSGDGEELSQGQRQLLSIARAAVADPPVLILDGVAGLEECSERDGHVADGCRKAGGNQQRL